VVPSNLPLKPSTDSAIVLPVFYGGPLDGAREPPVKLSGLIPRIRTRCGRYEMVGFTSSVRDDHPLKQFAMDLAVYEWT